MPDEISFGNLSFDVTFGGTAARRPRDTTSPFCMAVLGDFSGRSSRGLVEPLAGRKPCLIDVDNFDQVIARFEPVCRLPIPGETEATLELLFESLEDAHPDQFISRVPSLATLLDLRRRLKNSSTAAAAVAEVQTLLSRGQSAPVAPSETATESTSDTLARLMGKSPGSAVPSKPTTVKSRVEQLVKGLAAPRVVPGATAEQTVSLGMLEAELTGRLRAILHHPQFQALEATWRAVDLLVRRLDADGSVKIFLVDVSKEELQADLMAQEDLGESSTWKLFIAQPWAAVVGHYSFDDSLADIQALGRLAQIAACASAPFLAAASSYLAGCDSFHTQPDPSDWKRTMPEANREAWLALRQMTEASSLCLALPRFLLRQPYGNGSDAIETFPFEELPADQPHEAFLWGNPAILSASLLGESFQNDGWQMSVRGGEVDGLPLFSFLEDGEKTIKPCAEAWLSQHAADALLSQGLTPVQSVRGRDGVSLAPPKSLRLPASALAGRWGS